MKVKFADKIYDVLYTMKVLGKPIYAVEDEPNHIDWLVNVEVINEESEDEDVRKWLISQLEIKSDVNNSRELELMILKSIAWLEKQGKQNPTWSEYDELMLKDMIEFIESGWSNNGKSHLIYWLKSIKDRIK